MSQSVAEGTLVLTRRGQVPIQDVLIGDEVWTHQGRWRRVVRFWDQGRREVVTVQGFGNQVGLRVTPDHKLWVRSARRTRSARHEPLRTELGTAGWTQAQELVVTRKGGAIASQWASPCHFAVTSEVPVPEEISGSANLPDWSSPDLLWLYGLYLAEGSLSTHGTGSGLNTVVWSVHEDEVAEVETHLEGAGLRYRKDRAGPHCVTLRAYSRPLAIWMQEHGGKLATGKRLATWVFGLEDKQRDAVLAGYVFGDGHMLPEHSHSAAGSAVCSTVSKALAVDIRLLGQSCGYQASMRVARPASSMVIQGRLHPTQVAYEVRLSTADHTRLRRADDDTLGWSSVACWMPDGFVQVYDIEVEEDHSFVADGVVVSNCAWAVENDDILSTLADVLEGLMWQKCHFELFDNDQQDVWNQWAADVNLDGCLRQMGREEFKVSQFYVGLWWERRIYQGPGRLDPADEFRLRP